MERDEPLTNSGIALTPNRDRQGAIYMSFSPIAICNSHKHNIYFSRLINHLPDLPTLYSETFVLESNQVESCANHSAKPTVFMLASIR